MAHGTWRGQDAATLQQRDLVPVLLEGDRGGEAGEAASDHDHPQRPQ